MDFASAITAIRTATRYDTVTPSPVTNPQVTVWLNSEIHRFRRAINAEKLPIYRATSSPATISSGAQTLTKPADFEALVRIERQVSSTWVNVEPAAEADMECCDLGFEEVGATYLIWPSKSAPGTYRIVYALKATDGVLEVPDGMEDVVVERVCARVKERLPAAPGDMRPADHRKLADDIWREQLPLLKRRLGRNLQAGFRSSYRR